MAASGVLTAVQQFVQSHDKAFVLLGAGLVLLGFIAKENLGEQSKELATNLKGQQSAYDLDQHFGSVSQQLQNLDVQLIHLRDPDPQERLHSVAESYQVTPGRFHDELADFNRAAQRFDSLPYRPDKMVQDETYLRNLAKGDVAAREQDLWHAAHELQEAENNSSDVATIQRIRKKRNDAWSNFNLSYAAFSVFSSRFKDQVLEEAKRQIEEQEWKVKTAGTMSSWAFYIGWAMGLAGKFLKVPDLSGGGGEA